VGTRVIVGCGVLVGAGARVGVGVQVGGSCRGVDVEVGRMICVSTGIGFIGFNAEFGLVKIIRNTAPIHTALNNPTTVKIFHTRADMLLEGAFWASA
jgi:hypothetical protein